MEVLPEAGIMMRQRGPFTRTRGIGLSAYPNLQLSIYILGEMPLPSLVISPHGEEMIRMTLCHLESIWSTKVEQLVTWFPPT